MAHASTHHHGSFSVTGFFRRMAHGFGDWLTHLGETDARICKVQALMELSDQELASRGLRREDIVKQVFADRYWI